ncbi:hypothetical protein CTEN210_12974 [Chaetoceros tenuissimus]|uniref:G-protein coupled receptors family 1 profile domain-containing protein n=1 Tax=Chaetoceros tenuissimus TaxID=426638 RepID=A0AAD3D2D1_9STRA|nr:hypothetical protein CTEN210_12974 [Chaetoceros tenuissimus]
MIIKNDGLRQSPYSRIIFGLSFGDIMLSLGLVLGPFAAPKGTRGATWAIGNVASCEAIGFIMNMGISGVPFYVAFLAFYFDQRVRHKLSRQAFARKYETKLHILIWLYPIIGGIVAICLDFFNPGIRGNVCIMTNQPLKCKTNVHDKKCMDLQADKSATEMFRYYQMLVPFLASFFIMVYCLTRLTVYVYQQEKMFLPEDQRNISWKKRFQNFFKSRKETQEDSSTTSNEQEQPGNVNTKSEQDTTGENIAVDIASSSKDRCYSSQQSPLFEQSDASNSNESIHGGLDSIVSEIEDISSHAEPSITSVAKSILSVDIAPATKELQVLDSIVNEKEDIGTGIDSRADDTLEPVKDNDIENNRGSNTSNSSNKTSFRTSTTATVSNSNESATRATPINDTNQLAKAALLQSSLYIAAWLLTYAIPIVGIIISMLGINLERPLTLLLWKSILWPLGGLFNVFIYSRPKVKKLRESSDENKNRLWIVLFAQVIMAGGEVHSVVRSVSPIVTSEEQDLPVNSEEAKKYDSIDAKHVSKSLLKGSLNEEEERKFYAADYRAFCISSEEDSSVEIKAPNLKDIPEDSEC